MKRPGGFDGPPRDARRDSPPPPAEPVVERFTELAEVPAPRPELAEVEGVDSVRAAEERLRRAERERKHRERREQRRFTAHRRTRRRRWLVLASAVIGLALFVAGGVFTPVMAVREIEVHGASAIDAAGLEGALSRFEGVPLALVRDDEVHRALEEFPLIQRYAIERVPPATLIVRIEERHPAIALERTGGYDLFDPAGVLLFRVEEVPVGVPIGNAELSDTSSPEFAAAARVVRDMPQAIREQMVTVRATNAQDVSFTLASGTEVVWGEPNDIQRKAAVLESVLVAIGAPEMVDVSAPETPVFR